MRKVLLVLLILLAATIAVQPAYASITIEVKEDTALDHKHGFKTRTYDRRKATVTVAPDQSGIEKITITWKQRSDKKDWVHAVRKVKPTVSSWIHPYQTITKGKKTYNFKAARNVREAVIEILFERPRAFPRGFNVIAENSQGTTKTYYRERIVQGPVPHQVPGQPPPRATFTHVLGTYSKPEATVRGTIKIEKDRNIESVDYELEESGSGDKRKTKVTIKGEFKSGKYKGKVKVKFDPENVTYEYLLNIIVPYNATGIGGFFEVPNMHAAVDNFVLWAPYIGLASAISIATAAAAIYAKRVRRRKEKR